MNFVEIKYRLAKLNRKQKYLSKIFKRPEADISKAIHGTAFPKLLNKIIIHLEKLEASK